MTSGVYTRNTLSRDYHGHQRIRMVRRPDGTGTDPVVLVACKDCGASLERCRTAVRLAIRENRGFTCKSCNARNSVEKRQMCSKKSDTMKFLERLMGGPLTFGEMMRYIREADGLTQQEVATKVGVSKQHVSDVEHSRKKVSIERAAQWAEALGYPPTHFVRMAAQEEIDATGIKLKVVMSNDRCVQS